MSNILGFVDSGYSSHGDVPTPEQIANWTRRTNPPENEVPGAVPWSALLGRSTNVAVALVGARAYSTGIRLEVAVRARHASQPGTQHLLHQDVFGTRAAMARIDCCSASSTTTGESPPTLATAAGRLRSHATAQPPPPNLPQGGWFEAILRPDPQQ